MATMLDAQLTPQPGPLHSGAPIWITFSVANRTAAEVAVVNPDVGRPSEDDAWPFGDETYQIAVLAWFDLIELRLTTAAGADVPSTMPNPWATPILMPPLKLAPGDSFALRINLSDCFDLREAGRYHLAVRYGDAAASAQATLELMIDG